MDTKHWDESKQSYALMRNLQKIIKSAKNTSWARTGKKGRAGLGNTRTGLWTLVTTVGNNASYKQMLQAFVTQSWNASFNKSISSI